MGRGGPGETGRSVWLDLASGLSGGVSSSGGDGVRASRSGPVSLRDKQSVAFRDGCEDPCGPDEHNDVNSSRPRHQVFKVLTEN